MPPLLQATFDVSLHQMVQAIVTVLAVINPVVCGAIFLILTPKLTPPERRWKAVKVALSILVILVTSALVGLQVLRNFGISLDAFRIVGGMIIAYMGFDMLSGRQMVGQATPDDGDAAASHSLVPLIMFAAGPGTITAVVTLAAVHTPDALPVTAVVAAVVGSVVTFAVCFLLLAWGRGLAGHAGHGHSLYGAHCGVDGDAVCADGVESFLHHLAAATRGVVNRCTRFGTPASARACVRCGAGSRMRARTRRHHDRCRTAGPRSADRRS